MTEVADVSDIPPKTPTKLTKKEQKRRFIALRHKTRSELLKFSAEGKIPPQIIDAARKYFPKNYWRHGIRSDNNERSSLQEIGAPITLRSEERDLPIHAPEAIDYLRRLRAIDFLRTGDENSEEDSAGAGPIVPCL